VAQQRAGALAAFTCLSAKNRGSATDFWEDNNRPKVGFHFRPFQLMAHQDRDAHRLQHRPRHPTQHQFANAPVTVAAHHDQVGTGVRRARQQQLPNLGLRRDQARKLR
jgi:hypothetical protein